MGGIDMQRTKMALSVCAVLLMLATPLAHGQTAVPGPAKQVSGDEGWQFTVAPYVWAVSVDSKVIVGNYSASSTMTFSDILSDAQVAGQVHLEARKGRFGLFLDSTYLKLREDTTFTGVHGGATPPPTRDLTLTSDMWIIEFGAFYQVSKWPLDGNGRSISIDVLGGGRYWYLHTELDTTSPMHPSNRDDFVDPIIGARLCADLTDKLVFNLRGDIGGFGVGSDFSWNGVALLEYRINPRVTAGLGYRVLYLDYKPSTSRARYQVTMQGPIAGVAFLF
jgi:hypothetical protein